HVPGVRHGGPGEVVHDGLDLAQEFVERPGVQTAGRAAAAPGDGAAAGVAGAAGAGAAVPIAVSGAWASGGASAPPLAQFFLHFRACAAWNGPGILHSPSAVRMSPQGPLLRSLNTIPPDCFLQEYLSWLPPVRCSRCST